MFLSDVPSDEDLVQEALNSRSNAVSTHKRLAPKSGRRRGRATLSAWFWEILSLFVALACLITIIVILIVYQDKAIPRWSAKISLNTWVAVFSAMIKATLTFAISQAFGELKWIWFSTSQPVNDFDYYDSASRGAWGSLLLLIKRRGGRLAWFGAILTIVSLGMEPFTQQIIHFYTCALPSGGDSASVSRANSFTGSGPQSEQILGILAAATSAASYEGIAGLPARTSVIPFECSTGNCTFPRAGNATYTSLAMCSVVKDISHLLNVSYPQATSQLPNATLPSGLSIVNAPSHNYQYLAVAVKRSEEGELHKPLITIEAIMTGLNCQNVGTNVTLDDCQKTPWAVSADITPCIKTYADVKIQNNVLVQTLLSSAVMPVISGLNGVESYSIAGEYPPIPGIDCTPVDYIDTNRTIPVLPSTLSPESREKPNTSIDNIWTVDYSNQSQHKYIDPGCVYEVGPLALAPIQDYFQALLGDLGHPRTISSDIPQVGHIPADLLLQLLYRAGKANLETVSEYVAGIVDSMDALIRRDSGEKDGKLLNGTAWITETCTRVRWAWLTPPITILLWTFLFVLMSLLACDGRKGSARSEARRELWRSSSLPLLWIGLPDTLREQEGFLESLEDMHRAGEQHKVSLRKTQQPLGDSEGRWLLTEQECLATRTRTPDSTQHVLAETA